jgi:hypothetical protein
MAFLNDLAKGFVRSAVNQVGRDGGKVISNQVYGNQHATPIRVAGNIPIENSENLIADKEYIYIKLMWACLLSIIIPIIGGLIVVYRGYVNKKKTTKKMYKLEKQAVYKTDRRHTTGQKFEGYQQIKVPIEIDIDEEQKKKNKIKSTGYFIIGILSIILYSVNLK